MKNTIKKISAFLLSLVLIFGIVPLADLDIIASAETYSGTCGDNLTWTLDTETGELVISGEGEMYDWTSSSSAPWDDNRSYIKTVTIADGVTSIGDVAFVYCTKLTNIDIPDSVKSIGSGSFNNCTSLTSIEIPNSVTSIGKSAFYYCISLTSIEIPDSVTSIGESAFYNCGKLASVTIGKGVTNIGEGVFSNCTSLTNIEIPDSVTSIGERAFSSCKKLTSVIIDNGVTNIGDYAFSYCYDLISVTFPESVTSIGESAFYDCGKLTSVTIGKGVTIIGNSAFDKCTSLTSITVDENNTVYSSDEYGVLFNKDKSFLIQYPAGNASISYIIPDSVTSIGERAFFDCDNLTSVTISIGVTSIDSTAFSSCNYLTSIIVDEENAVYSSDEYGVLFNKDKTKLVQYLDGNTRASYTIPDSVTSIDERAFSNCLLTSIEIPYNVTSIGDYAFYNCDKLTSVTIGNGVTSIGDYAFSSCDKLTGVTIGNGVTSIGSRAFAYCYYLTNVTIPEGVKSIGDYAFERCYYLPSITIPDSVTSIGEGVFSDCYYLPRVTIGSGITNISEKAFYLCESLTSIEIPDSVNCIGDYAFYSCGKLARVKIGNGVTSIGSSAFYYCENLSSVTIGNSVKSIEAWAFAQCEKLTSVTIGNGVTSIGDYAFTNCTSLTNIDIPDSVKNLGDYVFSGCYNLTSVTIGNSITSIGEGAFRNCTVLTDVYYMGDVAEWCAIDFATISSNPNYCGKNFYIDGKLVEDLTIPECVTSIGASTFVNCENLTSVTIPDSITVIGSSAFRGCSSLTDVYYNGTEKQWNEIAIGVSNDPLLNANIHFLGHECDYTAVVTPPTCQTQGYTTYTCEECGDSYVDDYTDTVDHYYLDGKCIWCGDTNVTPSSIIDITYTPSDSARKLFTVTCADRAQMIQFIEPDGGTRTYYRNNANVKITSYNADGEVVGDLSRDLAYEVWEIYSNMSIGTTIKVRAKFNSRWELDKRSLVVYEYNPVISMELSRTSGKKGPVPATVVADEKTENVKFKMPNGTSVTVTQFTTDENGNRVFKGNAWANEDGLNVITVTIRRKNVTKTVGTLEYTVE